MSTTGAPAVAVIKTASDEIRNLWDQGKQDQVTKELVLKSLGEHGIHDLPGLAQASIQAAQHSQPRLLAEIFSEVARLSWDDAVLELLFGQKAQAEAKTRSYVPPKLPFVIGDRHYKPSEVGAFNGRVLHFIWDPALVSGGFLRAVSEATEYRAFLNASRQQKPADPVLYHAVPGTGHTFYEHINYGGHVLGLDYRHAWPNLAEVTMSGWWFWAVSWDNRISSLRTGSGEVVLADRPLAPYLTGPTITFPRFTNVPSVGSAWNDRTSGILG